MSVQIATVTVASMSMSVITVQEEVLNPAVYIREIVMTAKTPDIVALVKTQMIYNEMKRKTTANSRFAKAGVSCFYDSEVLNSSFVHLMKFSAENPRLRKAAKR